MPKRKCKYCKEYSEDFVSVPRGTFCTMDHAVLWANAEQVKQRDKQLRKLKADSNKEKKVARAKHRADKERVKRRSEWLDQLQTLVNQWILHVRDKDEPCCTCKKATQGIKYDAGHMISRGSSPELRFELTNIHKQCSVNCNQHGSGMRAEYERFIIRKYGKNHLDWLLGPHKTLKDKFPHYTDIKDEIAVFRKILRKAGLTPYV